MKPWEWIILDKERIYLRREALNIIALVEMGQTKTASLEMLSEELVTFKKRAKSFFEKHKSTYNINIMGGSLTAVITVSELLVV